MLSLQSCSFTRLSWIRQRRQAISSNTCAGSAGVGVVASAAVASVAAAAAASHPWCDEPDAKALTIGDLSSLGSGQASTDVLGCRHKTGHGKLLQYRWIHHAVLEGTKNALSQADANIVFHCWIKQRSCRNNLMEALI